MLYPDIQTSMQKEENLCGMFFFFLYGFQFSNFSVPFLTIDRRAAI